MLTQAPPKRRAETRPLAPPGRAGGYRGADGFRPLVNGQGYQVVALRRRAVGESPT